MESSFTVAIVGGTGNLGGALALRLGAPGVKIIIGSRDAEKAKKAVETLKPSLRAGEIEGMANQAAVKGADFVVIGAGVIGVIAIVGASYIHTQPFKEQAFFAHGDTEFAGVDARWMRGGVQLRGETSNRLKTITDYNAHQQHQTRDESRKRQNGS